MNIVPLRERHDFAHGHAQGRRCRPPLRCACDSASFKKQEHPHGHREIAIVTGAGTGVGRAPRSSDESRPSCRARPGARRDSCRSRQRRRSTRAVRGLIGKRDIADRNREQDAVCDNKLGHGGGAFFFWAGRAARLCSNNVASASRPGAIRDFFALEKWKRTVVDTNLNRHVSVHAGAIPLS